MTSRDAPEFLAWDEERNGPDYKRKLETLLIAVGEYLGHEAEPTHNLQSPRLRKIRELFEGYGGRELKTKAFWDHVKKASDEVRKWPAWKRQGSAISRRRASP